MAKRSSKKTGKKKATKKKTSKRSTSRSKKTQQMRLETMSINELKAQLQSRQRRLRTLQRQRERLLGQLSDIDTEIFELGGTSASRGKRPGDAKNLGDVLAGVLQGKQMRVTEAARAAQEAGYRSSAESFSTIVNQRLISDKRFKKVSRGVYTCAK